MDELVALAVDLAGLPVQADPEVGFAIRCPGPIPWDRVRAVVPIS